MNTADFFKMAHGDLVWMRELAFDYFNETRRQMTGWLSLMETENFSQLRADLHRCKGGASIFGLERLVALLSSCESPAVLESSGFDLATFEHELSAAESAVEALSA